MGLLDGKLKRARYKFCRWNFRTELSRSYSVTNPHRLGCHGNLITFFRFGFEPSRSTLSRFFDLNGFTPGYKNSVLEIEWNLFERFYSISIRSSKKSKKESRTWPKLNFDFGVPYAVFEISISFFSFASFPLLGGLLFMCVENGPYYMKYYK